MIRDPNKKMRVLSQIERNILRRNPKISPERARQIARKWSKL